MLDTILRNCTLADGRTGIDIGIENGRIVAVEPALAASAARPSTPPASSSPCPSSTPTFTWTRRSTAFRG